MVGEQRTGAAGKFLLIPSAGGQQRPGLGVHTHLHSSPSTSPGAGPYCNCPQSFKFFFCWLVSGRRQWWKLGDLFSCSCWVINSNCLFSAAVKKLRLRPGLSSLPWGAALLGIMFGDVRGAISGLTGSFLNTEWWKGKSSFISGGLCSVKMF